MMPKMNAEGDAIQIKDLVDADGNAAETKIVLRIPVFEKVTCKASEGQLVVYPFLQITFPNRELLIRVL